MTLHGLWRSIAAGVLLLLGTASSHAQDVELCSPFKDGTVAPEQVQAMLSAAEDGHLYRIQPSTSRVGFCVNSQITQIRVEFHNFQGGLSLWPDPGEDELAMVVIRTASLDADGSIIEHTLRSEHFFDVENYPEILFVSTGIHWTSQTTAELRGDLTLHGVTRAVTLLVQLTSMEKEPGSQVEKIVAKAGTTISRSDFGMDKLSQLVDDSVELCMSVEAIRHDVRQSGSNNLSEVARVTAPFTEKR